MLRAPSAPLDDVLEQAQWGDVILFKCRMPHTAVVRFATRAEYDHVAVVVVDDLQQLCLLEACVLGVRCFPFAQRVREYAAHFADTIAWRRLLARRTDAAAAACARFVDAVDGKPYSYDPGKILFTMRKAGLHSPRAAATGAGAAALDDGALLPPRTENAPGPYCSEPAYYCSELVAALFQHCGVMQRGCRAASFWPADFQQGGVCERWLTRGVMLAPEVLCKDDGDHPGGSRAKAAPTAPPPAPHNTPAKYVANAGAAVGHNLTAALSAMTAAVRDVVPAPPSPSAGPNSSPPPRPPTVRVGGERAGSMPGSPSPSAPQGVQPDSSPTPLLRAMSSTRTSTPTRPPSDDPERASCCTADTPPALRLGLPVGVDTENIQHQQERE
jgi:hypothetical protein